MPRKTDPRTHLIAETFNDDWATGPASGFARQAAARARRRHSRRRALVVGSVIAAAAVVVVFISLQRNASSPHPAVTAVTQSAPVGSKLPSFEIISDEQLMTELHDRPILILPGEREGPRIVVLDR